MNNQASLRSLTQVLRLLPLLLLGHLAQADIIHFRAVLSGAAEAPPNASPGTGTADILYDSVNHTQRVIVTFSNLFPLLTDGVTPNGTTQAHVHGPTANPNAGTAGVATELPLFTGFPTGVTSGHYDHTFNLLLASSWNPAFVTASGGTLALAEARFVKAMSGSKAYLNIHTRRIGAGEIRGFLQRVPDTSATVLLLAIGLGTMAAAARSKKFQS